MIVAWQMKLRISIRGAKNFTFATTEHLLKSYVLRVWCSVGRYALSIDGRRQLASRRTVCTAFALNQGAECFAAQDLSPLYPEIPIIE